jgi:hypothetical protein
LAKPDLDSESVELFFLPGSARKRGPYQAYRLQNIFKKSQHKQKVLFFFFSNTEQKISKVCNTSGYSFRRDFAPDPP